MQTPVPDVRGYEDIPREDCLDLLQSVKVGRIAGVAGGRPFLLPVNYAVDGDRVVFRTSAGTKLTGAEFGRVAFEIDGSDASDLSWWSVVVEGVASDITDMVDERSARLRSLDLHPFAPGEKPHWVAIQPESITGRRLRPPAGPR